MAPLSLRRGWLRVPGGPALRVRARHGSVRLRAGALELSGRLERHAIELQLEHFLHDLRHIWIPHLAPSARHVIGDRVFRSPAIILAEPRFALALVPDLDDVAAADGWQTWLDYDHPRRRIVLAAGRFRLDGHVLFRKEPVRGDGRVVRLRLHVRASDEPRDCADPYRLAARFLWRRWGRPRHARGGCQAAPLEHYQAHVADWAFTRAGWGETVWQSLGDDAGAPAFIVDVAQHPSVPAQERRWREQRSAWNQAWFSTQRCANGLLRYARTIDDPLCAARAHAMTAFTLSAPQREGLFPSVLTTGAQGMYRLERETPGWDRAYWTSSDRRPPAASADACHLLDAASTARMLVEWHALTGAGRALDYARRFADRLVALQRPSGAFPGWVEPDGRVVRELAESTESAMGATLLFELGRTEPALAALRFLVDGPIAAGRWEDFETWYSCCPWGRERFRGRRIPRNGVHKQNTLSIFWCAEALLAAWRATRERRWLALSRRCLDELSLYQAVWDPPFLPAPAHGGFGVMNADNEWNDARQSLFAPLYLDAYRETGEVELFERGVAALRASFSLLNCPENEAVARAYQRRFPFFGRESWGFAMENQGHGSGEAIGTFTIYTWGNGSALAAAATVRDRFGQVYVDAQRGRALAIDGCTVHTRGDRIDIEDRFARPSLELVYDDGRRRVVKLTGGRANFRLSG